MAKVLYIAGYGRCGSTVLATVLGNHPAMVSLGEVSYLYEDWANPERPCSCERPYAECEFWRGSLDGGTDHAATARMIRWVERASSLPRHGRGTIPARVEEEYRASQHRLFTHALARRGASIVVDSSKSARLTVGRAIALRKLGGHEVYFLHLVRNGVATLASRVVTGSNWALEGYASEPRLPTLRATVGWVWSNCCASLMRRVFDRQHYLMLRYEDFLADPATALRKIGTLVGLDVTDLVEGVERGMAFEVGHVVGGNRVRYEHAITLRRTEQGKAGRGLSSRQRLLFGLLGGWLNRLYGYPARLSRTPAAPPRL